jgi:hypothetical protein
MTDKEFEDMILPVIFFWLSLRAAGTVPRLGD